MWISTHVRSVPLISDKQGTRVSTCTADPHNYTARHRRFHSAVAGWVTFLWGRSVLHDEVR